MARRQLLLHSLVGFGAGAVSPALVGATLDASGAANAARGWLLAFLVMGAGSLLGALPLAIPSRRDRSP